MVHHYDGDLSRLKLTDKPSGESDIEGEDSEDLFHFDPCTGLNKMFGWPNLVQGNIFTEAQYAANGLDINGYNVFDAAKAKVLDTGVEDWLLLFQIDSDENAEMMWVDMGVLYFMIKKDDLAAGRLDPNLVFSAMSLN